MGTVWKAYYRINPARLLNYYKTDRVFFLGTTWILTDFTVVLYQLKVKTVIFRTLMIQIVSLFFPVMAFILTAFIFTRRAAADKRLLTSDDDILQNNAPTTLTSCGEKPSRKNEKFIRGHHLRWRLLSCPGWLGAVKFLQILKYMFPDELLKTIAEQ